MTDEERKDRLNYHMYITCETPAEHAERIVALEELCADMLKAIGNMDLEWHSLTDFTTIADAAEIYDFDEKIAPDFDHRMDELGVPR